MDSAHAVFVTTAPARLYCFSMSIRKAAGEWAPLLLGVEQERCGVCRFVLSRRTTFFMGGWQRCSVCHRFVHYLCLARGKSLILKRRPRVCRKCKRAAAAGDHRASHADRA